MHLLTLYTKLTPMPSFCSLDKGENRMRSQVEETKTTQPFGRSECGHFKQQRLWWQSNKRLNLAQLSMTRSPWGSFSTSLSLTSLLKIGWYCLHHMMRASSKVSCTKSSRKSWHRAGPREYLVSLFCPPIAGSQHPSGFPFVIAVYLSLYTLPLLFCGTILMTSIGTKVLIHLGFPRARAEQFLSWTNIWMFVSLRTWVLPWEMAKEDLCFRECVFRALFLRLWTCCSPLEKWRLTSLCWILSSPFLFSFSSATWWSLVICLNWNFSPSQVLTAVLPPSITQALLVRGGRGLCKCSVVTDREATRRQGTRPNPKIYVISPLPLNSLHLLPLSVKCPALPAESVGSNNRMYGELPWKL